MIRWAMPVLASLVVGSAAAQSPATELTVYSSGGGAVLPGRELRAPGSDVGELPGFGWVNERIQLSLPAGVSTARYTELPALIDPTTAQLHPHDAASVQVQAQHYQFDLGSAQQLLRRYAGRRVEVDQVRGGEVVSIEGLLLDARDGLLLQDEAGDLRLLREYSHVRLPSPGRDFIAQPTLTWTLQAQQATEGSFDLRYETDGMTWWADYRLSYSQAEGCEAQVSGLATVVNRSGAAYRDVRLHLVAGQPHRIEAGPAMRSRSAAMLEAAPAADFERHALSDYHLYTLQRPVTLLDGAVQQLPLLPEASKVACEKTYRYGDPDAGRVGPLRAPLTEPGFRPEPERTVRALLAFENSASNGLGVPLPAGRVRVTQTGPDRMAQFVAEDRIDHTPADETVQLALGQAFDLVGERTQQDFSVDEARRIMEETFEIRLRNHKRHPVTVQVYEHLSRWRQWQIMQASQDFEKLDADTIRFGAKVPADGETVLRYRVRYTW